jgi:hypothetical protein
MQHPIIFKDYNYHCKSGLIFYVIVQVLLIYNIEDLYIKDFQS